MGDEGDLQGPAALVEAERLLGSGDPADIDAAVALARQAHADGVPGAGAVFADCVDRSALYSGRPQAFGTVTYEHQGELHLAPVDPGVPDDLRLGFGVPPLADLRAEVEEANKERARARTAQPGRTEGQPYARVWRDPDAATLRDRAEAEAGPGWREHGAAWADGDELTFVCARPLQGAIVGPLFELPMWRVEDLLVLTVRVERLDELVLTYGFWPLDANGAPAFAGRPDPDGRWRGSTAPPSPPTNDPVLGRLVEHTVDSAFIGSRRVLAYVPPGHTPDEELPVVYATDGQGLAAYARRVDAAIAAGTLARVVLVGAHAAAFDPVQGNLRALEYLYGFDPRRFDAHQRFFVDELSGWAETELGVSARRERRAIFGCSDGAGHALFTSLLHPERFAHVVAFSAGVPPNGNEGWPPGRAPLVQLCAGTLEPAFLLATWSWHKHLERAGLVHRFVERVAGHEPLPWVEELPAALARAFPA